MAAGHRATAAHRGISFAHVFRLGEVAMAFPASAMSRQLFADVLSQTAAVTVKWKT